MPNRDETGKSKSVEVPQYEEYRTGSCIGTVLQWLGGIGLAVMGLWRLLWPESLTGPGWGAAVLFLGTFLVSSIRARIRSRENQEISRRNRIKYDRYRSSLKSHEEKKK